MTDTSPQGNQNTESTTQSHSEVLANPPLAEIVFEIKFNDPNVVTYDLLIGELYSRLKANFPINEVLKPKEMPSFLLPFIVQHRFRATDNGFPLYQLGPGIMSFNIDGSTYNQETGDKWNSFKTKLLGFLRIYSEILGSKFSEDYFEHFSLRFINKIEDTEMYPEVKNYFSNKLRLKIDLEFATDLPYISSLEDTKIAQTYNLNAEKTSKLQYSLNTVTEGSRKLLMDMAVISTNVPQFTGIEGWLDDSHTTIETFFDNMTQEIQSIR